MLCENTISEYIAGFLYTVLNCANLRLYHAIFSISQNLKESSCTPMFMNGYRKRGTEIYICTKCTKSEVL